MSPPRPSLGRYARRLWPALLALGVLVALAAACQRPAPNPEQMALPSPPAAGTRPAQVEAATAYPVAGATTPRPPPGYPDPPPTPLPGSGTPRPPAAVTLTGRSYLPVMPLYMTPNPRPTATPTMTPTPSATPSPSPTPTPTIDFAAVRAQLLAEGSELGFAKIGFHAGAGGNRDGLGEWMRRLDMAGVPFFIKSADDSGPLVEAQEIARQSDVPHVLVYRRSGDEYDTPDYTLAPEEAARRHWALHKAAFPPELDPGLVWFETINEVDKNRAEWLGRFALETGRLALAEGYRWAAFGWSAGEPEAADWQTPSMLQFLRLAAANPDRLAIALHEYSYLADDIGHDYPYKVGRFQLLYEITDRHGIPRPTVLVTEWGWTYQQVPSGGEAIADLAWAAAMYAPYPQVRGAAIWYLGGGFGDIADQAQKLIRPVTEFSLGTYYAIPLPPAQAPIDPEQFRP